MIPERQEILDYLVKCQRPRKLKKIAAAFNLINHKSQRALQQRLYAMQSDGQLVLNRQNGYGVAHKMDILPGIVIGNANGYGFFHLDQGEEDWYLSPRDMRGLLDGDRILARVTGVDRKGRKQASMVKILQRANEQVVGRYFYENGIAFVVPHNKRLHQDILIKDKVLAESGQYVIAKITHQPDKHTQPLGKVVDVWEDNNLKADMAMKIALHSHTIPHTWSPEVLAEAEGLQHVAADDGKRENICDLPLVTIDGENAQDFDDAVYCERQGKGWRLLVAIADPSHYVQPGSAIDQEAAKRGNSVYFPQRVVPMLPEILSNNLCSLQPEEERLCVVCELHFDSHGVAKKSRFFTAIMRSASRLSYQVMAALVVHRDDNLRRQYPHLVKHLDDLYKLYQLLHQQRSTLGMLDFSTSEACFAFTIDGRVSDIAVLERNHAHRLIEEFMLAANVATAKLLLQKKAAIPFRVHDTPDPKKLKDLHTFLGALGLSLGGGKTPTVNDYTTLMQLAAERNDAHVIDMILLRSMSLAIYSTENKGHFGLAFDAYTHFTSPIRRYPDLLIHRTVKHLISGGNADNAIYTKKEMQHFAEHCSATDHRAEQASRDVAQWYKCDFMREKIGEVYSGHVIGVTAFGLFVELDKFLVDGLVHITALPADYYHFDPIRHCLLGERNGKYYRLGDRVWVRLVRVGMDDRKIDFELSRECSGK